MKWTHEVYCVIEMTSKELARKTEVERALDHTFFRQSLECAVSPVSTERGVKPQVSRIPSIYSH